jgi:cell division protein FtsI (penicillin-binding protein 3)
MAWSGMGTMASKYLLEANREHNPQDGAWRQEKEQARSVLFAQSKAVPDLCGLPLRRAMEVLAERGIMPRLIGQGVVVSKQRPKAQSDLQQAQGKKWTLWLSNSFPAEESS